MAHDFLISVHSQVIPASVEKPTPETVKKTSKKNEQEKGDLKEAVRHRTVGVSMSPKLKERAMARAEAVGLSFSRYVQWCIEAELDGASLESRFRAKGGMGETRPSESKPSESKPSELKPSEPKPSEAKSSEVGRGIKGLIQRAGLGGGGGAS
jgi:hypothetical protein